MLQAVEVQAFFAPKTSKGELGEGKLHVDLGNATVIQILTFPFF